MYLDVKINKPIQFVYLKEFKYYIKYNIRKSLKRLLKRKTILIIFTLEILIDLCTIKQGIETKKLLYELFILLLTKQEKSSKSLLRD